MAVLTGLRRSPQKAVQVVLASALALLASCSGTSQVRPIAAPPSEQTTPIEAFPPDEQVASVEAAPEAESAAQDEPPSLRTFSTGLEVTWSVGVDEAPAAPDDRMLYLAPSSPVEGVETDAVLRRIDVVGVGIRDYEHTVALKWPTGRLSVKLSPAMSCQATSDGATWEPVEIRGVQGCEWTNEAGLYFAKWTEGATNFKYSSFDITGVDAREMLAEWEPLE